MVRTKKWHTRRSRVCHWCSWNLFVLYYKELKYTEKSLFISNFPTLTDTKIAFDVIYCLYKMKRTDWLLCLAKNCDWFKESRHCQIWIERRLSWKRQSLWKLNQNCVINKSETKCRKKSSHFLSSERLCKPKNTWAQLFEGRLMLIQC